MTKRSARVGFSADELDALLKAINPILIVEGQAPWSCGLGSSSTATTTAAAAL